MSSEDSSPDTSLAGAPQRPHGLAPVVQGVPIRCEKLEVRIVNELAQVQEV